ncbi:uncharacterized protein BJX67DRAFT_23526 [Aspergillus lucknowensis]|uniref:Uncharacterized protein n=1 Tax=Aspergillus lucknowensis TaxID=176173 RepID=A0ABR4LXS7_9EURO
MPSPSLNQLFVASWSRLRPRLLRLATVHRYYPLNFLALSIFQFFSLSCLIPSSNFFLFLFEHYSLASEIELHSLHYTEITAETTDTIEVGQLSRQFAPSG